MTVTIYQAQNNKISLSQTNSHKTMIPKFDSANDCNVYKPRTENNKLTHN